VVTQTCGIHIASHTMSPNSMVLQLRWCSMPLLECGWSWWQNMAEVVAHNFPGWAVKGTSFSLISLGTASCHVRRTLKEASGRGSCGDRAEASCQKPWA
jgi:hypothetical protein